MRSDLSLCLRICSLCLKQRRDPAAERGPRTRTERHQHVQIFGRTCRRDVRWKFGKKPALSASTKIKDHVANRDANGGCAGAAKNAVGKILQREIAIRQVCAFHPTCQSHPSTSRSWIGSTKEQLPMLVRNSRRMVAS